MKKGHKVGWHDFMPPFLIVVITVLTFTILHNYSVMVSEEKVAELGVEAVKLMYDFGTVEQLDYQMSGLKQITTDDVFNQLTIDNSDRTLQTYFKFKNSTVTVHVIESTSTYVLYWLETENISADRLFIFMFDIDITGKINYVKEVEAVEFVDSDYSTY